MRLLTKQEFKEEGEPMFKRLFLNYKDSLSCIEDSYFRPEIRGRTIIYPLYGEFELPTIDAIITGALNLGDSGCYLRDFLASTQEWEHSHVYLSELKLLYSDEYVPEELPEKVIKFLKRFNHSFLIGCIYSETGKWGIWKWEEGFGILGGPQEFLAEIRQKIPNIDRQVYGLLWEYQNSRLLSPNSMALGWLPGLLTHVYGEEVAERILEDIGTGSL